MELLELEITNVAHGGIFVARHEGRVIFVSDAIDGERVLARVSDTSQKNFWRADTVEVLCARRADPQSDALALGAQQQPPRGEVGDHRVAGLEITVQDAGRMCGRHAARAAPERSAPAAVQSRSRRA